MSPAATQVAHVLLKQAFCPMTDAAPTWGPVKPHNHLPALPPAHELETRVVLKACIEARAALAELKQAAELMLSRDNNQFQPYA